MNCTENRDYMADFWGFIFYASRKSDGFSPNFFGYGNCSRVNDKIGDSRSMPRIAIYGVLWANIAGSWLISLDLIQKMFPIHSNVYKSVSNLSMRV